MANNSINLPRGSNGSFISSSPRNGTMNNNNNNGGINNNNTNNNNMNQHPQGLYYIGNDKSSFGSQPSTTATRSNVFFPSSYGNNNNYGGTTNLFLGTGSSSHHESSSLYPSFTQPSSSSSPSASSFLSLGSNVTGGTIPIIPSHSSSIHGKGSSGGMSTVDSQLSLHSLSLSDSLNNSNLSSQSYPSPSSLHQFRYTNNSSPPNNNYNSNFNNRSIPSVVNTSNNSVLLPHSHPSQQYRPSPPPLPPSNSSFTSSSSPTTASTLFPSSSSSSTIGNTNNGSSNSNPIYGSLLTTNDIAALESIGFHFDTPNNNNNQTGYPVSSSSLGGTIPSNVNPNPPNHHHHHQNTSNNTVTTSFTASGLPETTPLPPHHLPHNGPSSKTKICRYYLARANNHFGKTCSYVHPCRNIIVEGHCRHGRRCTDDHICREFLFFGETTPHGCRLGDNCRFIHIRQEVDRLFLIEMFRDWIAVKRHEAVAANQLGSSSAAVAAVQSEVMLAAQHMGANSNNRMPCPFWYTDTMAGCKAGPECVYEHRGQFQLPTRPLPNTSQIRFAERSWEKRRQQESGITNTNVNNAISLSNSSSMVNFPNRGGTNGSTGGSTNDLFSSMDFTANSGNSSAVNINNTTDALLLNNFLTDNNNNYGSSNNNNIGLDMFGSNSPTTLSRISSLTALDSAVAVAAANLAATAANAAAVARAHGSSINLTHVTAALSGVTNVLQNDTIGTSSSNSKKYNNNGSPVTSTTPTSITPSASRLHLNLAGNNNSTNSNNGSNSSPAPDMSPLLQPSPLLNAILTRSTDHSIGNTSSNNNNNPNNSSPSSSPYVPSMMGRIPSNTSLAQLAAQAHAQAAVQTLHKNASYETLSKLAIHQAQQQQLNSSTGIKSNGGTLSPSTSYASLINRTSSGNSSSSSKGGSNNSLVGTSAIPLLFTVQHDGLLDTPNPTNITLVSNNAPLPPPSSVTMGFSSSIDNQLFTGGGTIDNLFLQQPVQPPPPTSLSLLPHISSSVIVPEDKNTNLSPTSNE